MAFIFMSPLWPVPENWECEIANYLPILSKSVTFVLVVAEGLLVPAWLPQNFSHVLCIYSARCTYTIIQKLQSAKEKVRVWGAGEFIACQHVPAAPIRQAEQPQITG